MYTNVDNIYTYTQPLPRLQQGQVEREEAGPHW